MTTEVGIDAGPDGDGQTITVAICDDHDIVAEGLAAVLEREPDLQVLTVVGTTAAIVDQAAELQPDVVLIDFKLPDANGAVATRRVLEVAPDTMVIMLTSHSTDEVLTAALQAGCSGFITKDRPVRYIVGAIRKVAAGEALISAELLGRVLSRVQAGESPIGRELTVREREILTLLSQAADNRAMADVLSISVHTVRNHVANLLTKLGAHSRLEAVLIARREGLVDGHGE